MATQVPPSGGEAPPPLHDRPIGELLSQLADQTTTLVRQELKLFQVEMTDKGKRAGVGVGMLGAGGLLGVFAFAALTTCLIAALSLAMPVWLAALIVAVVYAAIAAVLALRGKKQVQEALPPTPDQTVQTVKEDVEWAKTRAESGRR